MIKAKTVVPNRYWILQEDNQKIGNIEAVGNAFSVKIKNKINTFSTLGKIKQQANIDFEPLVKSEKKSAVNEVYGYATSGRPYNAIYNVQHQVPLWTRDKKSKSWYAAGWFRLQQGRHWETVFCPKLITLERYAHQGPYHTEEEANGQSV